MISTPVWEGAPTSEILERVFSQGFAGAHRGGLQNFFELLAIGVSYQAQASAWNDEEWMNKTREVVEAAQFIYPNSTNRVDWAGLRSAVIATIRRQQVPTAISAPCFTTFQVPDLANRPLLQYITAGLGVCLVWYEIVNGSPLTRCFQPLEGGQRLYFVYMGRERGSLFVFYHSELGNPESAVVSMPRSADLHPQLIFGELERPEVMHDPQFVSRLFSTLLRVADCTRAHDLKPSQMAELGQFLMSWEGDSRAIVQSPLQQVLNLDEVRAAFSRLHSPSANDETTGNPGESGPQAHLLKNCMHHANLPDEHVSHVCRGRPDHWFHRLCLVEYIEGQMTANESMICPICHSQFSERFVEELSSRLRSLKDQILREQSKKKAYGSM